MPRYSSSVRAEARRLVREGATQKTVAKKLKVSEGTLSRWLKAPAAAAAPKSKEAGPTGTMVVAPKTQDESSTYRSIRAVLAMASIFDSTKVAIIKVLLQ